MEKSINCCFQKSGLIIFICFICTFSAFSTNIDSLLRVAEKSRKAIDWNNVALCHEEIGDTTQLRICAQKAYQLAQSENNPEETGIALLRQSTYEEYSGNLDKAIEKSVLALEYFRKLDDPNLVSEATSNVAYYYYETGCYDQAIETYHDIIEILHKNPDILDKDSKLARSFLNIALSYQGMGIADSILHYNHITFETATKAKDTTVLIEVSYQLGILNTSKKQFKKALLHYEEALRLVLLKKNNLRELPYPYINIALAYVNWGKYDLALDFAHKAEEAAKVCGDQIIYAKILSFVGAILIETKNYTDAISAAKKSISITKDVPYYYYNSLDVLAYGYCLLLQPDSSEFYLSKMEALIDVEPYLKTSRFYTVKGLVLTLQGKYDNAIFFLEKSIELKNSTEKATEGESLIIYQQLSEAYQKGPKDYQKAFYYKQMQYNLADSIHKREHSDAIAEFGIKHKTAEKELEITQLNLQQEQTKSEKARVTIWLVVIVALFLGALLYNMILRQKKRTEKILLNQKLEEKEREFDVLSSDMEMRQIKSYLDGLEAERTRLAGELHDNVSNALLGVEFKMRTPSTSQEEVSGMLHGIHEHVRNISHALMPPVFQHATLAEVIADYVYMQNGMSGPRFECYMEPEDGWEDLPQETALELHRIVQEACGNALKHSGASLISIILQRDGNHVTLIIKDNGRGMDVDSKKSGLGLQIIRDRAAKMNGSAEIVSAPGQGTTITVTV